MNQHVMKRIFFFGKCLPGTLISPLPSCSMQGTVWECLRFQGCLSPYLPIFLCPLWIFSCSREGSEAWNRSCQLHPGDGFVSPAPCPCAFGAPRAAAHAVPSSLQLAGGTSHAPQRSCRDCIHFVSSLPPSPTCAANSSGQKYCGSRKSGGKAPGNEVVPQINKLCLSTGPT